MEITSEGLEMASCQECGSRLVLKNAPFYLHGEYIGDFESLVCEKSSSHFSALTESGYIKATRIAEQRGLIGPTSEEEKPIPLKDYDVSIYTLHFPGEAAAHTLNAQLNHWINMKVIKKPELINRLQQ